MRQVQVFVATMGASNYTYAEATWSQQLPDWIRSHTRLLTFLGGVPELLISDNLKSKIKEASFYDPQINPTFREFAAYYQFTVLPTRPWINHAYRLKIGVFYRIEKSDSIGLAFHTLLIERCMGHSSLCPID